MVRHGTRRVQPPYLTVLRSHGPIAAKPYRAGNTATRIGQYLADVSRAERAELLDHLCTDCVSAEFRTKILDAMAYAKEHITEEIQSRLGKKRHGYRTRR
jgi:hypothetical protein